MSSIRSTLIRSCFANIQRELTQLEDWLNRDYAELPQFNTTSTNSGTDSNIIYQAIQQLSKQLDSQQHTLHHIIDRIDVLEETRNIHINDNDENEPNNLWLDTEGVQLQNEMIDNEYDHIINVNKTEDVPAKSSNNEDTVVVPIAAPIVAPIVAPIATPIPVQEPVVEAPTVPEPVKEEPVVEEEEVEEQVDEVEEEQVTDEPVPEEPVAEVEEEPTAEEPATEEPATEEPATEEEEDNGDELDEFEYNGKTYYLNSDLTVYEAGDEGELEPVGVWREKSQTIKFYKK